MAVFQPVVDPKTKQPTGLYFYNGAYYKYDPARGYVPTSDIGTPEPNQSSALSQMVETLGPSRSAETEGQKLVDTTYGTTPQDYSGIYKQAYESLGQPTQNVGNKAIEGLQTIADAYVDRVYQKTGKLPEASDLRTFVAKTLDRGFASQTIKGINKDQIIANYVDPYIENQTPTTPVNPNLVGDTTGALEKIYGPLQEQAIAETRRQFAPLRSRAIEEEAALGRLRSGVSAAPESAIGQVDVNEGNALSNIISNILQQKASGTLDLTKFGETLNAGERRAKEAKNEFGQTLAFNKQAYQDQADLANRQLSLAEMIGRAQAKGKDKDWLDYLNSAVGTAGTALSAYKTFGTGGSPSKGTKTISGLPDYSGYA